MMYPFYINRPLTTTCLEKIAEDFAVGANKKSAVREVKGKRAVAEKKATTKAKTSVAPKAVVTVDRRDNTDRRTTGERRQQNVAVAVERRTLERRAKVSRRRQIDPTTCERDYSTEEIEFMNAMDEYKRRNGRMFPTCSEVLEVVRSLGYEKRAKKEDYAPIPVAAAAELCITAGTISTTVVG